MEEVITPESCCQEGIGMESGEMPPPLSAQAVSEAQGPAALEVVRSVPPTETMLASSAGHASFDADHAELSPDAAKKFCPCEAIFSKYGSSVLGSAGVQPHEQLSCFDSGASVVTVIALIMAVSVFPTYTYKPEMPGAMPSACVMSRICSVSSQSPPDLLSTQLRLLPSVEMPVTVAVLVCPTLL